MFVSSELSKFDADAAMQYEQAVALCGRSSGMTGSDVSEGSTGNGGLAQAAPESRDQSPSEVGSKWSGIESRGFDPERAMGDMVAVPPKSPSRQRRVSASGLVMAAAADSFANEPPSNQIAPSADVHMQPIEDSPQPTDTTTSYSPPSLSIARTSMSEPVLVHMDDAATKGPATKADSGIDLDARQDVDVAMGERTQRNQGIPQFYFPRGRPAAKLEEKRKRAELLHKIKEFFPVENGTRKLLTEPELAAVTEAVGLPRFTNSAFFLKVAGEDTTVSYEQVERVWINITERYHDATAVAFAVLKQDGCNFLTPADLEVAVEDVVQNHPGLDFLSTLAVFQARYVETVVARVFYSKTQNWNNKMTLAEFRKSGFVDVLRNLEKEDDINSTRDVFSYKHFYVIYCKFWELDADHDMIIDRRALGRYDRGALTPRVIDRVIQGYGKPSSIPSPGLMSYKDFIWFILSAEDKQTAQAIEYWFRCLDVDGDGVISLHEMREFWEEQYQRMVEFRMSDPWRFDDFVCSLLDLIKPAEDSKVTLSDLKRCGCAPLFFDMIFDIRKYDVHVRRIDPMFREMDDVWVADHVTGEKIKLAGWDKFAERAYEELAVEEQRTSTAASYRSAAGGSNSPTELVGADDDDDGAEYYAAYVDDLDELEWEDSDGHLTFVTDDGVQEDILMDEDGWKGEEGDGVVAVAVAGARPRRGVRRGERRGEDEGSLTDRMETELTQEEVRVKG
ncbi:Serine/threonine-protein phosphatase 2A regulatory subunit B'' subunit alpha [Borealophlyctis nickersoniae]|nr:Serine/threonine-protein phosphatase 2A regulatory subunit B'' subunit alpha [Borealophlyctis nickersoniae]